MDIKARIAQRTAELQAAKAKLSDDDRAEMELREEENSLIKKIKEEEEIARNLDLDRRLDRAVELTGRSRDEFRAVAIEGYPDTFIVERNNKAHQNYFNAMAHRAQTEKGDLLAIRRAFALAIVYDFNGDIASTEIGEGAEKPELTLKLKRYFEANPGTTLPLTTAGAELAGVFAASRKS